MCEQRVPNWRVAWETYEAKILSVNPGHVSDVNEEHAFYAGWDYATEDAARCAVCKHPGSIHVDNDGEAWISWKDE